MNIFVKLPGVLKVFNMDLGKLSTIFPQLWVLLLVLLISGCESQIIEYPEILSDLNLKLDLNYSYNEKRCVAITSLTICQLPFFKNYENWSTNKLTDYEVTRIIYEILASLFKQYFDSTTEKIHWKSVSEIENPFLIISPFIKDYFLLKSAVGPVKENITVNDLNRLFLYNQNQSSGNGDDKYSYTINVLADNPLFQNFFPKNDKGDKNTKFFEKFVSDFKKKNNEFADPGQNALIWVRKQMKPFEFNVDLLKNMCNKTPHIFRKLRLPYTKEIPVTLPVPKPAAEPAAKQGKCGQSQANFEKEVSEKTIGIPRIANINEWPWIVSIRYNLIEKQVYDVCRERNEDKFYSFLKCAGILISKRHILTSADCFDILEFGNLKTINSSITDNYKTCHWPKRKKECGMLVHLGYALNNERHQFNTDKIVDRAEYFINTIFIHESYKERRFELNYNIAVIRLEEEVTFSESIQPICLPPPSQTYESLVGKKVIHLDWPDSNIHQNENQFGVHPLKAVTLPIYKLDNCSYAQDVPLICTGKSKVTNDNCKSAPFVMKRESTNQWEVVGIYPDSRKSIIRVAPYVDWINEKMKL